MKTFTLTQKVMAEMLGTFTLTAVVMASLAVKAPAFPTPVLAALTLAAFVWSTGKISGTHLNPAVTLGLASINKIDLETALKYIVAQSIGAFGAYLLMTQLVPGLKLPTSTPQLTTGIGEMLGTILFGFGIASIALNQKVESTTASFVIGTSLLLGIVLASPLSLGVLNPAVALGLKLFSWHYIVAPVIGSVIGFGVYSKLSE